jgi:hypothetical protein
MDMQHIQVIGAQSSKAQLDFTPGLVCFSPWDLGCENDLFTSGRHYLADPLLALAVAIRMRRVDVPDAHGYCLLQCLQGLVFLLIHQEAAARSEPKNRDFHPGSAEGAGGQFLRFSGCHNGESNQANSDCTEKLAAIHKMEKVLNYELKRCRAPRESAWLESRLSRLFLAFDPVGPFF